MVASPTENKANRTNMFLTKSDASTKRQDQAMKQGRIGRYGSKVIATVILLFMLLL